MEHKIVNRADAQVIVNQWKGIGLDVVFTNGCFDILHLGHLKYLQQARALGQKLVIGLNDDASVTRLKGVMRPINDQQSRAMMLAALEFVDLVVLFHEDTPAELIDELIPDFLVKGGDYPIADIVGAKTVLEHGGQVLSLPFEAGFSSTNIINRIKQF